LGKKNPNWRNRDKQDKKFTKKGGGNQGKNQGKNRAKKPLGNILKSKKRSQTGRKRTHREGRGGCETV